MQATRHTHAPRLLACAALAALLATAGCLDFDGEGTRGELDRVTFSWERSCFYGCALSQPLLTGSRETLGLTGPGNASGVEARTPDPDLVELSVERSCRCEYESGDGTTFVSSDGGTCGDDADKECSNRVHVLARAAGEATIELRSAKGSVIDRTQIQIHDAARASLRATLPNHLPADVASELTLEANQKADLELVLYDDAGRVLLAPEGVTWRSDGTVCEVGAWLVIPATEISTDLEAELHARTAGTTELEVQVPGLHQRWPVTVQPAP